MGQATPCPVCQEDHPCHSLKTCPLYSCYLIIQWNKSPSPNFTVSCLIFHLWPQGMGHTFNLFLSNSRHAVPQEGGCDVQVVSFPFSIPSLPRMQLCLSVVIISHRYCFLLCCCCCISRPFSRSLPSICCPARAHLFPCPQRDNGPAVICDPPPPQHQRVPHPCL